MSKSAAKAADDKKWRKKVFKMIDHPVPQLILGGCLLLSLFLAESWVLGNSPDSTNDALYGILSVIFVIFVAESVVLSMVQDGYWLSFFFWMDVIGEHLWFTDCQHLNLFICQEHSLLFWISDGLRTLSCLRTLWPPRGHSFEPREPPSWEPVTADFCVS
jgi:hypothetical protein